MPADVYKVAAGSALALQAADQGYVAVSIERAGFGERRERRSAASSLDDAIHMLLLGRTAIGQTVAELDELRRWIGKELSTRAPIYLAGYSAAGTAAIMAAAAIEEFAGAAVGGCVGLFRDTILRRGASGYNDVPGLAYCFEFDSLLALIAPRPCVVVAGVEDHIWPYDGAAKVVSLARVAYHELDANDALILEKAPGGHTYYPDLLWPALGRAMPGG